MRDHTIDKEIRCRGVARDVCDHLPIDHGDSRCSGTLSHLGAALTPACLMASGESEKPCAAGDGQLKALSSWLISAMPSKIP